MNNAEKTADEAHLIVKQRERQEHHYVRAPWPMMSDRAVFEEADPLGLIHIGPEAPNPPCCILDSVVM